MHRDRLGIVVEGGVDVVDFGAEGHLGGIGEVSASPSDRCAPWANLSQTFSGRNAGLRC